MTYDPSPPWPLAEDEPDPRWSLANERTLLAYQRTALALVATGFAVAGSHAVTSTPRWLAVLGLPLIALGAAVGIDGRSRFVAVQRAMRTGADLTPPRVARFLPWGLATVALFGFVLGSVQLAIGD